MIESGCDKTECQECSGLGGFDDGPKCSGFCRWCGGCYDQVACDACKGSGEVDAECIECGDEVVLGSCVGCR